MKINHQKNHAYALFIFSIISSCLLVDAPLLAEDSWNPFAPTHSSPIQKPRNKMEILTSSRAPNAEDAPVSTFDDQSPANATPNFESATQGLFSSSGEQGIGIGVGQTTLMGDFSKFGENKITVDAYYKYSASYSFDAIANIHYSKHSEKNGEYSRVAGTALGIKGKFFQYDAFSPFALGGVGFYLPKIRRQINNNLLESKTKLAFGVHFGGGVDIKLNNFFTAGLLAHYHNPFDVKQDIGPKVNGSYFKIMVTAMYTFNLL